MVAGSRARGAAVARPVVHPGLILQPERLARALQALCSSGGPALVPAAEQPRRMRVIRKATNLEQVGGLEREESNFRAGKTLKEVAIGERASEDRPTTPGADGAGNRADGREGENLKEDETRRGKAANGETQAEPEARDRPAERSLEVGVGARGRRIRRASGPRSLLPKSGRSMGSPTTRGQHPATSREALRIGIKSLDGKTPNVAAGCNEPVSRSVEQTVERSRKPDDGT